MNIPEQIRLMLWGMDKSQVWLAKKSGVTVATVNSCINGRHDPKCGTADLLLKAMGHELCIRKLEDESINND